MIPAFGSPRIPGKGTCTFDPTGAARLVEFVGDGSRADGSSLYRLVRDEAARRGESRLDRIDRERIFQAEANAARPGDRDLARNARWNLFRRRRRSRRRIQLRSVVDSADLDARFALGASGR